MYRSSAVASGHVVGRDGPRRLLVVAQTQRHMVRRLIETNQSGAEFDLDAVVGRGVRAQAASTGGCVKTMLGV